MLSFLMGKKRRKNERSRMGNNQAKGNSEFGTDERTESAAVSGPTDDHIACQDGVNNPEVTFVKDLDCEDCTNHTVPEKHESERVEKCDGSPSIEAPCQEMGPALRITRHHSLNSSSEASQCAPAPAGLTDDRSEPPTSETYSSKEISELEKSRKAFFLGLLEGTVEEIYPEEHATDGVYKAIVGCPNQLNPADIVLNVFDSYANSSNIMDDEVSRRELNERQTLCKVDQLDVTPQNERKSYFGVEGAELKSMVVDEDENYDEASDEESGTTWGDVISTNDASDGKVTDSGLGIDENQEYDEILHTEQDDISLEDYETEEAASSIDPIPEMKIEITESEACGDQEKQEIEVENSALGLVGREHGFQLPELGNNCVCASGEGSGSVGSAQGRGLSSGPVNCSTPTRYELQLDDMLTLRNGPQETFPRSNLTLSSSSDDSIGAKVKKHVRWADTVDGRNLESYDSYDSYSSEEDDDGSGNEGNEVQELVGASDLEGHARADLTEDDEIDEDDSSESEEESESDEEENKALHNTTELTSVHRTGADDTFTDSDITVVVTDSATEAEENDQDDDDDSEEEEIEEETGENYEEDETEPKTEENLVEKLTRLQEELLAKAANLERAQSDLDTAVLEADKNSKKMGRLQDECNELKQRNNNLQQSLENGTRGCEDKELLESRIADLERELITLRSEKHRLESRLASLERERDEEMRMVQQAMEEALKETTEREARYQKEFESERTLSSQRELQMLEDFEWKLRETEKNAKKKVEGAENEATKRVQDMEARLVRAEADLERLAELKLCEIELKQLKVTSSEQRRTLRQVTRQFEELQVNEKILQEEVNRLRAALDKEKLATSHLQAVHKDELAEKERKLKVRLDVQVSQITSEWEDRLRREMGKLKSDLENTYREEKIVAVDMVKMLKAQEISNLKQSSDKIVKDLKKELAEYKRKFDENEAHHKHEIENAQTSSDRDALDLRRKMDKLDMEYQSRIEKLQEQHEAEINELRQEAENKLAQVEATNQLQAGTTRTTIELVKQQLMNENQSRVERLQAMHRQQMDEQWEMLEMERTNEVRCLEDRHRAALEQLRKELDEIRKAVGPAGGKSGGRQKSQIPETAKQLVINQLNHEATNPFSCGDLDGIEAVSTGSDAEKILFAKLQQMARQANEDKAEIEKLRQQLEEKEFVKSQPPPPPPPQQARQQNPPQPSRRNRKRRN